MPFRRSIRWEAVDPVSYFYKGSIYPAKTWAGNSEEAIKFTAENCSIDQLNAFHFFH